ncbi:MAG TPA: tetratricopeptide repeat protein [Pyrinomonadaceae bacterium]|jgi:Tfp pilus assembly protein PilF|nr:tetratricopeptide repeat protein [Pyrinomonadaceae bacterium]
MKKNSYIVFTLVCAAFLLFVSGVGAQGMGDRNTASNGPDSGRYAIAGKVIMPDGLPAKNVKVSYTSTSGASGSIQSDDQGTFRISNIPSGNYTVNVKVEGLPTATESLTISREGTLGQAETVVLYLRNEGQKKGDFSANPLFKDVPKDAMSKYQKAKTGSDLKAALVLLDEAIAIYPQFAMAHYEKGLLYQKQSDLDNAMISFQKAIAAKPDFIDAKMSYGMTLIGMKNYELAASVFQDVMKQKNDVPASYYNFGIAMLGMNKVDIAEKAFKYALSLKGGESLASAHKYLGMIYVQRKQKADAITELEKYLELMPKAGDADKIKTTIEDLKKQG